MIDAAGLLTLIGFVFLATASPGGVTTLVTASGTRFGYTRSVPLMAGICFGMGSLIATIAGGLGAMLQTFSALELALRLLGTLYLLYLAWTIAQQGAPSASGVSEKPMGFILGFALIWINAKVWTLGIAASAAFTGLSSSTVELAAMLGGAFIVIGSVSASLWCLLGARLGNRLKTDVQ